MTPYYYRKEKSWMFSKHNMILGSELSESR
jgi:hypothetical protein